MVALKDTTYKVVRRSSSRSKTPSQTTTEATTGRRSKSPAPIPHKAGNGSIYMNGNGHCAVAKPQEEESHQSWAMDCAPKTLRELGGAIVLMTVPPICVILLVYAVLHEDGSLYKILGKLWLEGFIATLFKVHPSVSDMVDSMKVVLAFWIVQLAMMSLVPGPMHIGPVSPSGLRPVYKANGVAAYLLTCFLWAAGSYLGFFKAGIFYDVAAPMLAALSYFTIVFCLFLYFKGLYFPTTRDSGSTGSAMFDYFWGTELYPRFGHSLWSIGWDVKQFTNCRWGMMYWGVGVLSYGAKQYELYGKLSDTMVVSVLVQFLYVLKFFYWETGYFNTMDIQHDRAGFYICWGCLVWVPCLYTIHTLFLVENPLSMGLFAAVAMGVIGIVSVYINWDADVQKIRFRANHGDIQIWGKPAEKIVATYTTSTGEQKISLLLVSGWWGISRHFHYLPELVAAFCMSAPCLLSGQILGFMYFFFLAALLADRSYRDDARCQTKYGKHWDEYKRRVPYNIIPYVW